MFFLIVVSTAPELIHALETAERTVADFTRAIQNKVQCTPTGLSAFECIECLSTRQVLHPIPWIKSDGSGKPTLQELEQLSVVILYHLTNMRSVCKNLSSGCSTYAECRSSLMGAVGPRSTSSQRLLRVEGMLRLVKGIYMADSTLKCFTAEDILSDLIPYQSTPDTYVEKLSFRVLQNLLRGRCIQVGDAVTDFLEDLFKRYGDSSTQVITEQGLERLLKRLRVTSQDIGHQHPHEHSHEHDHHDDDPNEHDLQEHYHGEQHNSGHDHLHKHDHKNNGDGDHDQSYHETSNAGSHSEEAEKHDEDDDREHQHQSPQHTHRIEHNLSDGRQTSNNLNDSHDESAGSDDQPMSDIKINAPITSELVHHAKASQNDERIQGAHHGHDEHDGHLKELHIEHRKPHHSEVPEGDRHPHGLEGFPENKATSAERTSVSYRLVRRERSVAQEEHEDHEDHNHNSSASKCWSTGELIKKFGHSGNGTITRQEFFHLCPALIQQAVTDVCRQGSTSVRKPSTAELYGYGTLAVFIISLCSLVGVLLLPCLARYAYYYIMMGFIGLSFGTMTGDAMLHLIPQVLGLHSHEGDAGHEMGHDHDHEHEFIPSYFWKQLGLIGALYGLFVFEALSTIFTGHNGSGHGHSHLPKNIPDQLSMIKVSQKTESHTELAQCPSPNSLAAEDVAQAPVLKSSSLCCGMSTLAIVVIIGGAIHNVADGLAIGAAFSSSLKGGLSTSIAVFCHELPHEFGDFVLLISTGLGYKKALFLNFLSALAAFVGLYAGFQVGEDISSRNWILTVTAGIFLYVSLVDMLPELKQYRGKSPLKMFVVKNVGVLAGITFMCLISIYEDKLNI